MSAEGATDARADTAVPDIEAVATDTEEERLPPDHLDVRLAVIQGLALCAAGRHEAAVRVLLPIERACARQAQQRRLQAGSDGAGLAVDAADWRLPRRQRRAWQGVSSGDEAADGEEPAMALEDLLGARRRVRMCIELCGSMLACGRAALAAALTSSLLDDVRICGTQCHHMRWLARTPLLRRRRFSQLRRAEADPPVPLSAALPLSFRLPCPRIVCPYAPTTQCLHHQRVSAPSTTAPLPPRNMRGSG